MTDERSLDHQGLQVLSTEECWDLVRQAPLGRIAFVQDGQPTILPVNHGLLGHRIAIRTAAGALLNEALLNRPVAFEVDDFEPESRSGWSVLAQGLAETLDTDVDLGELGLDAWADAIARDEAVVLMVEEISGRRIVREQG